MWWCLTFFFCLIFSHHVVVLSKSRWPYQNSQWGSADGGVDWSRWELQGQTRHYRRVLLGIVVSRVCEDFLSKKETWSYSRLCLVCKWLKFFCRILNVTDSPNRTGSNLSILSGKWMWQSCEGGGNEELPLSFSAPCFHFSFCVPLACDFSRFLFNGELSCWLLRFSLLWEMVAST